MSLAMPSHVELRRARVQEEEAAAGGRAARVSEHLGVERVTELVRVQLQGPFCTNAGVPLIVPLERFAAVVGVDGGMHQPRDCPRSSDTHACPFVGGVCAPRTLTIAFKLTGFSAET
jgi:hypothetical protein